MLNLNTIIRMYNPITLLTTFTVIMLKWEKHNRKLKNYSREILCHVCRPSWKGQTTATFEQAHFAFFLWKCSSLIFVPQHIYLVICCEWYSRSTAQCISVIFAFLYFLIQAVLKLQITNTLTTIFCHGTSGNQKHWNIFLWWRRWSDTTRINDIWTCRRLYSISLLRSSIFFIIS